MAGRGDITAGRAFVELFVKQGAFTKGLADAQSRLRAFGVGLSTIGKGMLAMGAGILAPLGMALKHSESTGSALNDMAARTGASVEALAQLGYAAEQTGASIDDVESAIRKSQKAVSAAAGGSKEMQETLQALGVDYKSLAGLSTDDQFERIAKSLGGIQDPGERAAQTMKVFGKTGTALLPMIAQMDELRAEAVALGAPTAKDAKLADDLGDALGRLKALASNAAMAVGSALAPAAIEFLDSAVGVGKEVIAWVRANGDLIRTVAKVGAVIVSVGAGLVVAGGAFSFLASAGGTIAAVLGPVLGLFGLLANPVVIVGAGIAALAYGLDQAATGGKSFGAAIGWAGGELGTFRDYAVGLFGALSKDFGDTWKGIVDAVSAGDLQLAADVAWAGLMVAWHRGTQDIDKLWQDAKWAFLTVWTEASYRLSSLFSGAFAGLRLAWSETVAFFQSTWNAFANSELLHKSLAGMKTAVDIALRLAGKITAEEQRASFAQNAIQAAQNIQQGKTNETAIQDDRADRTKQIMADEVAAQESLKYQQGAEQGQIDAANKAAIDGKQAALDEAKAALKLKMGAAAGQAEAAKLARGEFTAPPGSDFEQKAAAQKTAGTFSAAGLFALGGGKSGPEKIAKDQLTELQKIDKNLQRQIEIDKGRQMEAYV